ncbi:Aste57867_367 [Aphanomyces stellatus]|uniref:Aste57867_367 protein n=1 Tax=Aphanomyces stellatus TaxID=120398 RepID=A0A485K7E1_9STRA|nr:hypothetical protein As57867_000366 [Aphanomyces stellatus]VFT77592.1 Aste57867_367 [Aphanomyces stellatus]
MRLGHLHPWATARMGGLITQPPIGIGTSSHCNHHFQFARLDLTNSMDFEAAAFVDAPVSQDLTKAITATAALSAGQVLFVEAATVASAGSMEPEDEEHEDDCDDDECGGCAEVEAVELDDEDVDRVSQYVRDHFDALNDTCEPLEALSTVDIRKNLFKCFHLLGTNAGAALAKFQSMDVMATDAAANLEAAKALRESHPDAIPAGLTDDQVAHLIGVLNKYSIQMEENGGSGLFYYIPKLKHSCTPNTSFNETGNAIWVTATEPIAAGQELTIDFFVTHYMCAAERQEVLAKEGIVCGCTVCTGAGADKTRAFKCNVAGCSGIVHPTKDVFACATCSNVWTDDAIAAAESQEESLTNELVINSVDQLNQLIDDSLLHPYHHIWYNAMEAVTDESGDVDLDMTEDETLGLLNRMIEAFSYVVSYPHADKVALYNSVAQSQIGNGNISQATEAYAAAYKLSQVLFGDACKETILFKNLMEHTPTTVEEMAAAYGFELLDEVDDEDEEA